MTDRHIDDVARPRPDGPPPGILGLIALVLTIASMIAYSADSLFWTGTFACAAAVPIGIYAATVYARLLRLGIRVPGPSIAFLGGITASILLATAALTTWAQTQVAGPLPAWMSDFVSRLVFALGGIGFAGGLGLLLAGIAVPSVMLRLLPRWLGWTGLVLAAIGEVSFLSLLWDGFDALLPITRIGGLIWLAAIGFLLPRNRHEVPRRAPATTSTDQHR